MSNIFLFVFYLTYMCFILYLSIQFIFHQNNKHILKTHKMEEMQLKAKTWKMLHPLYNLKQQQTSKHCKQRI